MSLKAFHIAFITLCSLLAVFLAVWSVLMVDGSMGFVWAAVSLAAGALLIAYARRFKRKMQDAMFS